MAIIAPEIKKQYFDNNGNPLSGGKLYVYEAGTTTLATSYTTEAGAVSNTNPIVLDSRGEVGGVFLSTGSFKFLLTDSSDVPIWTQDNITIRDFGTEIDTLSASVTSLNTSVGSGVESTRIVSGAKSSNSSQSKFLKPAGTTNQVTVLGTSTELVYYIEGTEYKLSGDFVASGLVSPPTTNNTALVNDGSLSGQNYTKTLGEFDSVLKIDSIGSEISSRNGKMSAFKLGAEYFIARPDTSRSVLRYASRGYYFNTGLDAVERVPVSDNATITLMQLTYLYLTKSGTVLASYSEPYYGTTEPSGPADGDMWYNETTRKWMRYSSTAFIDSESIFIGTCIQDENGSTVGARSEYFYKETSDLNTIRPRYKSATEILSKSFNDQISVYGNLIKFSNHSICWDITANLESGQTEAASTDYFLYLKEDGDSVISHIAPFDYMGTLNGYYHPYETWRYAGRIYNNASSNFEAGGGRPSEDVFKNLPLVKIEPVSSSYTVNLDDQVLSLDSTSSALTVTLPSEEAAKGKTYIFSKSSSDKNKISIVEDSGVTTISALGVQKEAVTIISDGTSWVIVNKYHPPTIGYIKDIKSGADGGVTTANTVHTRVLNDTTGDFSKFGSLASNTVTAMFGKYKVYASAPMMRVDNHQAFFYNSTATTYDIVGTCSAAASGDTTTSRSWLIGEIELSDETDFNLRHWCNSASSFGLGPGTSTGTNNPTSSDPFAVIMMERVDS